jgi:hypothetical protein
MALLYFMGGERGLNGQWSMRDRSARPDIQGTYERA